MTTTPVYPEFTLKGKLPVPDMDGIELIPFEDIVYCKSDGNYTLLVLSGNRKITASKTLKYFEDRLHEDYFKRIHKSYLANVQHIKKYLKKEGGELVMSNDDIIPLSRGSREEIVRLIQQGY